MEENVDNYLYYSKLQAYLEDNVALWQATVITTNGSTPARAGMKMIIPASHAVFGNLGGGELEHQIITFVRDTAPSQALHLAFDLGGRPSHELNPTAMHCGGSLTVFIQPLHLPERLYIIGAGHCGKALGKLAKLCGFYVHLVDQRPESIEGDLSEYGHSGTLNDYSSIADVVDFGPHSWIVIMTHGHLHDLQVLEQCLRKPVRYLGMIGSQTKVRESFAALQMQGFTATELSQVHAPIGLKIGSQSPFEIAVSIMAELIQILRQG